MRRVSSKTVRQAAALLLIVWLLAGMTGCRLFGRKKVAAPPAAPPPVLTPPAPKPAKPQLPPAPKIDTRAPTPKPPVASTEPLPPAPAPTPKPEQKRSRKRATRSAEVRESKPAEPPKPVETAETPVPAPTPPAVPTPKLEQILSAEQVREYTKNLETSLERVRSAMVQVQGKHLSEEQQEIVGRIRTFQQQAEQARERDLVTAVTLAQRADLLSRDLLDRLR